MERYVIIDSYDGKFLGSINPDGITTELKLSKAMIFTNIDKARLMMDFLNNDKYELNVIEFRKVCE